MECKDTEKVKPLDELLDDKIQEFESGEDKECDKDLDKLIWELGDFENEEPPEEADEFQEEAPAEEELVEKILRVDKNSRASFVESGKAEETEPAGGQLAAAGSLNPETRPRRSKAVRSKPPANKKK